MQWGPQLLPRFNQPAGLAVSGNLLYIVERINCAIKVMNLDDQIVSFLVGSTAAVPGYVNGAGDGARFRVPTFIVADAAGRTLYVSDSGNDAIRAVDISVTPAPVTTLAGGEPTSNTGQSGYADGTGTAARFNVPAGLALLGTTLYVADIDSHRIRAVDTLTRAVTTVAGDGTSATLNGPGASARFVYPFGLVVNGATLYVSTNDRVIRTIDLASADKTVGTLCGIAGTFGNQDGDVSIATLGRPIGMAMAGSVLYFADHDLHKIRAIDLDTNQVSTFSGTGTQGYYLGATALEDNYHEPSYLAVLGKALLVTEKLYHSIRAIEYQPAPNPSTYAGPDTCPDPSSYAGPDPSTYAGPDLCPDPSTYAGTDICTDSCPNPSTYAGPDLCPDPSTYSGTDICSDTCPNPSTYTSTDTCPNPSTYAGPDLCTDPSTYPGTDICTDSCPNPSTYTGPDLCPDPSTYAGTDICPDTIPDLSTYAGPDLCPDPSTYAGTDICPDPCTYIYAGPDSPCAPVR